METCLTGVTGKGRVVLLQENTRTRRARMHNLENVRLTRVDGGNNSIKVLKEQLIWCELRFNNRLAEVITRLLLKDFGACWCCWKWCCSGGLDCFFDVCRIANGVHDIDELYHRVFVGEGNDQSVCPDSVRPDSALGSTRCVKPASGANADANVDRVNDFRDAATLYTSPSPQLFTHLHRHSCAVATPPLTA